MKTINEFLAHNSNLGTTLYYPGAGLDFESINDLINTTNSILGYINGFTAFSSLQITNLNISGFTTLNNSATLLSSLMFQDLQH